MKACVTALLVAAMASAAEPVIVFDAHVPQYKEAADVIKKRLDTATAVDVQSVTAALAEAPLVVAVGQKALTKVRALNPDVPVLFSMVLAPTADLVSSSVSGVPLEADPAAVLKAIREVAPRVKRVGLVYDARADAFVRAAQASAGQHGLTLVTRPVASANEVRDAVAGLASSIDLLWLPADPALFSRELCTFLLGFAAERNLPLMGFLDNFTQAGALASVAADYADIAELTGRFAQEVLARPAKSRLPLGPLRYSQGRLTVNARTASALDIEVPEAILARAKTVFR